MQVMIVNKMIKLFLCLIGLVLFINDAVAQNKLERKIYMNNKNAILDANNFDAWRNFLNCWTDEISAIQRKNNEIQPTLWKRTKQMPTTSIAALEKRMKVRLPLSYKDFLTVSNGQFQVLHQALFVAKSAFHSGSEVGLFANRSKIFQQIWIKSYEGTNVSDEEYFLYGEEQSAPAIRAKYLEDAIEIGHFNSGVEEFVLLNPHVQTANGEFETWWLSPRLPGANRFKSFADFMISFYFVDARDESPYPQESQIATSCAKHIYQVYKPDAPSTVRKVK